MAMKVSGRCHYGQISFEATKSPLVAADFPLVSWLELSLIPNNRHRINALFFGSHRPVDHISRITTAPIDL